MIPKVVKARYERDYVIHIGFADGVEGDVDLKDESYGELFEPLKNTSVFEQVTIHPEFQTFCRPNGVDLAPEFL